jgi:hypothetical protein
VLSRHDIRELSHCGAVSHVNPMLRHADAIFSRQLRRACHSKLVNICEREMAAATR